MISRVAILISGSGSNMVALVKDMQAKGYAAPAIVVSNKALAGGLKKAQTVGVVSKAVPHEVFDTREGFEDALHQTLLAAQADYICLAGFMRILSATFISKWEGRILNIHPSLLPKYKGLNTHQRAIDAGETEAGCSVHVVTAELDGGQVLGQARVPIFPNDTADTLAARVLPEEHKLYPKALQEFLRG